MRLLSERDVTHLLTADLALKAAELAYRIISAKEAKVPLRTEFLRQEPGGVILIMPGLIGERMFGVKLIANRAPTGAASATTTAMVLLLVVVKRRSPISFATA